MADYYNVVYTGRLAPDVDLEQAAVAFAARFGMDPQRVRDMLEAGVETVIKSDLSAAQAREYRDALERMGLMVRVAPPLDEATGGALSGAPTDSGPGTGGGPVAFHSPRRMPAGHGWLWLKDGFVMVFAYPVHWIGALLIWTVLNLALNLIPLVNVLSALIAPVFMGGVMLGAHEQNNGKGFNIERLFAGFSYRFGSLLLVGVLYMLGFIAIALVMFLVLGGLFSATGDFPVPDTDMSPEMIAAPLIWFPVLLMFALVCPLIMAYWFAPALVILDDVSPLSAMGTSFRACLKNILPFLFYVVIAIVLFILGSIPLFLGLLVVIPAAVASVYASYRDIFRG